MNTVIKWMAEHPVAANLTMVFVVALGLMTAFQMPQKTYPEFTLDTVNVSVLYPGASPIEIQDSIVRPIEDQVSGVDGIDDITASISEGRGSVTISFLRGEDISEKLDEIKTEVDRITVFPEDAETPVVVQASNASRVLEIAIHGDTSERALKETAERLKDELVMLDSISYVEVGNVRDYEISIEIKRDVLRAYDLTLADVARVISENSLELPGGSIETDTLEVPIRTIGRNYSKSDFENIVVRAGDNGGKVYLRDIATVTDGFTDSDLAASFAGERSVSVNVFRVGDEQVLGIVADAQTYLDEQFRPSLEAGIDATIWQNEARELESRLDLLIDNAAVGLALVVLCLALFLDIRLAFWSAVGIAVSFAATFVVMGALGMSVNMISVFGFILAVGIVVDNAIVVSENIFKNGEDGLTPMQAAVRGTQRIAVPVVFSALTTIVAFWPLMQLPGTLGKFLTDIPVVVIIVLSLSLVQALIILPRNLSALDVSPDYKPNIVFRLLGYIRAGFDAVLQWFINVPLNALLRFTTHGLAILIPIALSAALMIMTVGLLANGYVKFKFFPAIDSDFVTASIEMHDGTTFAMTEKLADDVRRAALTAGDTVQQTLPEGALPVIVGVNVVVGQAPAAGGPEGGEAQGGPTFANVVVQITDPAHRSWQTATFENAWRDAIGAVASVKELAVSAQLVSAGDPVSLELSLPEGQDITPVVDQLRAELRAIPGVFAIADDNSSGRLEYRLALKQEARLYDVTLQDLASQTRAGFFGLEAMSVQRGGDSVDVMVRYPRDERDSLSDLLETRITTPSGATIPLGTVARIEEGQAPTQILRRNGRQVTTVSADLDTSVATSAEVNGLIKAKLVPQLVGAYPELIVEFGGEQRTQGDAQAALGQALGIALFVIFALLALVFRSYVQPIVVMFAIPLGLIGAVSGHYIMGIPLTILSVFGIIGLAGVVINNSLVMVDVYNEHINQGMKAREAVILGTKQRFRPILLTSLTTFLGVYPLIMETSLQAQFLIPLAVSIGYGVLIGTMIIVLTVPAVFMAQYHVVTGIRQLFGLFAQDRTPDPKPANNDPDDQPFPYILQAAE